jgi:hypothetical protein
MLIDSDYVSNKKLYFNLLKEKAEYLYSSKLETALNVKIKQYSIKY